MALVTKNVGPCHVYKGDASPLLLGLSFGGIRVIANEEVFEEKADISGNTSIGDHVIGQMASAEGAITAPTHEQLAAIFGVTAEGSTTKGVPFDNRVGKNLMDDVELYTLRPIVDGAASTVEADWIHIPAGTLRPNVSLDMGVGNQKSWGFTIKAHPVTAAHIAASGHLYNSGDPEYPIGRLLMFGKATSA